MVTPIIMPKFGQMTEDSAIVEWLKKEGDKVKQGDTLFTVETDKSVMEVESFKDGTLLKIAVGVGISVPVQSVVGYLGEVGEAIPDSAAAAARGACKPSAGAKDRPAFAGDRRRRLRLGGRGCRGRAGRCISARPLPHQPARRGARQAERHRPAPDLRQRSGRPHRRA